MKILEQVEAVGGQVWAEGEILKYRLPRAHIGLIDQLRAHKPEIMALLADENAREHFEERAAIGEYDGGLPRNKAEAQAARLVVQYRLTYTPDIWLLMLARPGDSFEQAKQGLQERFADRLLDARPYKITGGGGQK